MAMERTFAIIKPDAVSRGLAAEILSRIHAASFQIVAIKTLRLTKSEAEGFYAVHRARPFFGELTDFMSSGKAVMMVLEAEGAIALQIDEPGRDDFRLQPRARQLADGLCSDFHDPIPLDDQGARHQTPVEEQPPRHRGDPRPWRGRPPASYRRG